MEYFINSSLDDTKDLKEESRIVPVLLSNSYVLFPNSVLSLVITKDADVLMVEQAIERGEQIGVLLKRSLGSGIQYMGIGEEWYEIGCLGIVAQLKALDYSSYLLSLVGMQKFKVKQEITDYPYPVFIVDLLKEKNIRVHEQRMRRLRSLMENLFLDLYKISGEDEKESRWILDLLNTTFDLDEEEFMNITCLSLPIGVVEKQMLLEYSLIIERFEKIAEILEFEYKKKSLTKRPAFSFIDVLSEY